jgi:hypothetical protein
MLWTKNQIMLLQAVVMEVRKQVVWHPYISIYSV